MAGRNQGARIPTWWSILGGFAISVVIGGIGGLLVPASAFQQTYDWEPLLHTIQLIVATLMFGYYLGIALEEKRDYAKFLTGFLSGALIFGIWFLAHSAFLNFPAVASMIGGLVGGLYFGTARRFLKEEGLDKLIKMMVSGVGWNIQFVGITFSVNIYGQNVDGLSVVLVTLVDIILYLRRDSILNLFG